METFGEWSDRVLAARVLKDMDSCPKAAAVYVQNGIALLEIMLAYVAGEIETEE